MGYTKDIKQEVLIKHICGSTPKEIADETGIHFVTIYRWINDWKKDLNGHPLTDLPIQDIGAILTYTEKLKQRLEEAERSLSIIHTSGILQTIPLRQRISMALPLLDSYPARFLAQTFEVSLTSLVTSAFQDVFAARGHPSNLLFHSDRGSQYTAHEFRDLLLRCGVKQSFSAPGVPYDNAPMESFFASLKVEETHRYRYANMSDLTTSLREYISFYNERRLHSSIGNLTPVQAEDEYYKEQSTAKHIGCAPFACKK